MAMRNGSDLGTRPQSVIDDPEFLRGLVERTVQAILDAEMSALWGRSGTSAARSVVGTGTGPNRAPW